MLYFHFGGSTPGIIILAPRQRAVIHLAVSRHFDACATLYIYRANASLFFAAFWLILIYSGFYLFIYTHTHTQTHVYIYTHIYLHNLLATCCILLIFIALKSYMCGLNIRRINCNKHTFFGLLIGQDTLVSECIRHTSQHLIILWYLYFIQSVYIFYICI